MPYDADHEDFAFEHAPGLPEPLPKGESILWQGRPSAWRLAVDSLCLRWVIGYFALLAVWRAGSAAADLPIGLALASAVPLLGLGAATVLILWGFSWVQARATVYTVTTSRVILRIGAALQVTLQLPYSRLQNIALDLGSTGHGTIAFEPQAEGGAQLSYLVLWPHARPWKMRLPQPAFRCIPDAQAVATLLAETAEGRLAQPVLARKTDVGTPEAAPAPVSVPAE
ncbi:MAG: photosynthetic complex putative assembly protein PuhB [Pseudomonadota bacterium]